MLKYGVNDIREFYKSNLDFLQQFLMKIVYQDLIHHLDEKPSKEELSKKLFQLGHEHEIHGNIFDMELTLIEVIVCQ